MREIAIEIPVTYTDGEEEKIYIKAHVGWDLGNGKSVQSIDKPRVLSNKERKEIGV